MIIHEQMSVNILKQIMSQMEVGVTKCWQSWQRVEGGWGNADKGRHRGEGGLVKCGHWLTKEGRGVWTPPFLADIICEQPLYKHVVFSYTQIILLKWPGVARAVKNNNKGFIVTDIVGTMVKVHTKVHWVQGQWLTPYFVKMLLIFHFSVKKILHVYHGTIL